MFNIFTNKNQTMKTITTALFLLFAYTFTLAQDVKLEKLFNGKNLKGWVAPDSNIWWIAADGILIAKSGPSQKGSILWTKKKYKDFVIETEFLFGEGIVDSGIFIRTDKQQIQIGQSGSLKRDMTGSPYIPGKGYPVEASNVKEILNLEDWNTMKVQASGNEYTVWLNEKQVLNYESEDGIDAGPIGLQLHPSRDMSISFRNIKLGELK
jgi:hypothetical protein